MKIIEFKNQWIEKFMFKLEFRCTLCSFLCFLFFGCGKAVTTQEDDNNGNPQYLRPGSVNMEAQFRKPAGQVNGRYQFVEFGRASIPTKIQVTEGNASDHTARIFMNKKDGDSDFYCLYKGGSSTSQPTTTADIQKGLSYEFVECFDNFGFEMGLHPGDSIFIDIDHEVEIQLDGADPRYDTKAFTVVDFEW